VAVRRTDGGVPPLGNSANSRGGPPPPPQGGPPPRAGEDFGADNPTGDLAAISNEERLVHNSSPTGGGGPAKLVEGHHRRLSPPQPHATPPVPLPHPSDGPPPRAGEDLLQITHIRNTPKRAPFSTGAFSAAANASPSTSLVCAGSMMPSSHKREVA